MESKYLKHKDQIISLLKTELSDAGIVRTIKGKNDDSFRRWISRNRSEWLGFEDGIHKVT